MVSAIDYRLLQEIREQVEKKKDKEKPKKGALPPMAIRKLGEHPAIDYRRIRMIRGY